MSFNSPEEVNLILDQVKYVGSKGSLGVQRWDVAVSEIETAGVVKIPCDFGKFKFPGKFYYVYEEFGNKKMIFIRMFKGGEPFRLGDVHGFFGLSKFQGFKRGFPVMVVEGIADWVALRSIYPYVLCCFTAGVSLKQTYMLRNLTSHVITAFDRDEAGATAAKRLIRRAEKIPGLRVSSVQPNGGDFGDMLESEWGREQLNSSFERILTGTMGGDVYAACTEAHRVAVGADPVR